MKNNIKLLIEKLNYENRQQRLWKKIVGILSCFVVLITIYSFTLPAMTLNQEERYTFNLKDSYDYAWKDEVTTEYNLNLHFKDIDGNYIEGRDVVFEVGENNFNDDPYGFGYIPISGDTTRGLDLISALNLDVIVSKTGEKYEFYYAEVLIDGAWQRFSADSKHWDIWCQSSSSIEKPGDYGWRGKYGDDVSYIIDENTEYNFVYKLVRYGQSNLVETLGSDSGISFRLFNYSGDNSETGINANGLWNYFTFRSNASIINNDTDSDGFGENRARVLPKLENGYPIFDCRGYCQNKSLGYLFGSSINANGSSVNGVESYYPTNTLLQKESVDGVEYYYYDSNRNAVDYDIENSRFMVRDYVERSYTMTTYSNETSRYEFLPFNYWNSNRTVVTSELNNRTYNYEASEIDHWFGMTMEFSFYMPENGKINGKDMIFEFSGDDDVWVFIDDVLVLDLGGTHGAVDGTINFSTGLVEGFLNWNGIVSSPNKTNIYDAFKSADSTSSVEWNSNNTTFDNYTRHTLKFFYLERGAAVSNCKIKFNIPVLPSGSLSVKKVFNGVDNYNEDYEFTLYDVTNGSNQVVSDVNYTIGDKEFVTDKYGRFILKNNEVAIFKLTNYHKYYVAETNSGEHSVSYSCSLDGVKCLVSDRTDQFIIKPDSLYQAIFTNKVKTFDLRVSKIAYLSEDDEEFRFKIGLKDKNNEIVDILDDVSYFVDHTKGIVSFNLKNGEDITIKDIPIDTTVTLEEVEHDGYQVVMKAGDIILSNDNMYSFTMDSNKDITVHNTPGVTLPETGGKGILINLVLGMFFVFISLVGYRYLSLKEGVR